MTTGRDDPEGVSASRRRSRRSRAALVLILFVGLGLRLWVATITDNADARTLAWGSAFVATGHANPYREVVAYSHSDPIPLGGIRSLSLAQGYIGVAVGAVPMWVANATGLIHLGAVPDGHAFRVGEIFAYKLSYLVPELMILWCLGSLLPQRRQRWIALALWATTPLMVFTWGQGMPDTWTIAFLLGSVVGIRKIERAQSARAALAGYAATGAVVAAGAWGTKLLPVIMLLPLAVLVARDRRLEIRQRWMAAGWFAAAMLLFALPYLLDPYLRANMLSRFEFDMLFSGPGIATANGLLAAQFGLIAFIAVTGWLVAARNPWRRVEPWLIATLLILTTTAGIITHLMVWALVPIILLTRTDERAAVGVYITTGLAVMWHIMTYDWLSGLVVFAVSRKLLPGGTMQWYKAHIPAVNVLGGAVASALVLGAALAVIRQIRLFHGPARPMQEPLRLQRVMTIGSGLGALMVASLLFTSVVAMSTGQATWDMAYAAYPANQPLLLKPGERWVSEPVTEPVSASVASLRVDRGTQPSLDRIRVSLERNGKTLASSSRPVWEAEPMSDRGPVRFAFDRRISLLGARIVVERVVSASSDQQKMPAILGLEAVKTAEGIARPDLQLIDADGSGFAVSLARKLVAPGRLLATPLVAGLLAWCAANLLMAAWRPAWREQSVGSAFNEPIESLPSGELQESRS